MSRPAVNRALVTDEQSALVTQHYHCVRKIAGKFAKQVPKSVQYDDLVSAGVLGLISAARSYRPEHGVRFMSYAGTRIVGAIKDWLREQSWAGRPEVRRLKAAGVGQTLQLQWADNKAGDPLLYEDRKAASSLDRAVDADTCRRLLRGLKPKDRLAMLLHFGEGITMREVGEILDLSESRVSQKLSQLMRLVRSRLQSEAA